MGVGADLARRAVWQRRLRDFERSPETVGQFCDRMGLSVSSFYRWQRKLADRTKVEVRRAVRNGTASSRATRSPKSRKALTSPTLTSPTLTSPTLTSPTLTSPTLTSPSSTASSTSSRPSRDRVTPASTAEPLMRFLPIEIAASTHLEAVLPNGTQISVPCHDREIVRTVLAALMGDAAASQPREGERC